jgi:hypothetical protein
MPSTTGVIVGAMVIPGAALPAPFGVLADSWVPCNLVPAAQARGAPAPATLGPIAISPPARVLH